MMLGNWKHIKWKSRVAAETRKQHKPRTSVYGVRWPSINQRDV